MKKVYSVNTLNSGLECDINKLLAKLKKHGRAAVFLLKERELRRLKMVYMRKKPQKTTGSISKRRVFSLKDVDVLAFPEPEGFPHPETRNKFFGEIYINLEIARREPERAHRLAIHGLLHLLGYTHKRNNDTMKMEKKEAELLSQIRSTKF